MSTISTHILDTARGAPASGVAVYLETQNPDESWTELSHAWTDDDGRVKPFVLVEEALSAGSYRLVFDTEDYFAALNTPAFYPQVSVVFKIDDEPQLFLLLIRLPPFSSLFPYAGYSIVVGAL